MERSEYRIEYRNTGNGHYVIAGSLGEAIQAVLRRQEADGYKLADITKAELFKKITFSLEG